MAQRVSRAFFASHKSANFALSKAADLSVDDPTGVGVVGAASRTAPFIISTSAVDRDGDTLDLNGWDLDDYRKNPIVLFDHNPSQPIGRSEQIWIADNALRAIAWFPHKDVSELADNVFKLIEAGVLRTASVTFLPMEFTKAVDRAPLSPWGQPPMDFKRQKLLEWSVVSVPSNQEALHQAKGLKVDWRLYQDTIERSLDSSEPLAAPRAEYEKTHAVVKSFLAACKPPAKKESEMQTSKAGRVLNNDNLNRLKAALKHAETAESLRSDASKHLAKCAEHMKAVFASHNKGEETDEEDREDEEEILEQIADKTKAPDEEKPKEDEENEDEEKKGQDGQAQDLVAQGSGAGTVKPTAPLHVASGECEDYYRELTSQKEAAPKSPDDAIVASAKAALGAAPVKVTPPKKSIAELDYTQEELAQAVQIAVEAAKQKTLRELRGQVD